MFLPMRATPGVYVLSGGGTGFATDLGRRRAVGESSAAALAAVEGSVSGPQPLNSAAYANEVLQTECQGSGAALPSSIEIPLCISAGFSLLKARRQAQAALFWNDPGSTIQPPGHWLQIADTVTSDAKLNLLQTARATALAGIAMNDAGIAVWEIKYQENAWRPNTAIQDCTDTAGGTVSWTSPSNFNTCDANWSSLIATPPHPDYLAGHPAFSGAAATALVAALGY